MHNDFPTFVYLDNNIIANIEAGNLSKVEIDQRIGAKNLLYSYSDTHIYEAHASGTDEYINRRLETISKITNDLYFDQQSDKKFRLVRLKPKEKYDQIKDFPDKKRINQGFLENMSLEMRKLYRDKLGFDPQIINNIKANNVLPYIDEQYKKNGQSLNAMFEEYRHSMEKPLSLYDKFAFIFLILNLVGYRKDKDTDKSDFAGMWDANHATYASFCDCFVTRDERLIAKCQVAYNCLGSSAQIINL